MLGFQKASLLLALFASLAVAAEEKCPCYTATAWVENSGCPAFEPKEPCVELMCISLTTSTIPATNTNCKKTPTVTSYLPCKTACRAGCAVETTTVKGNFTCPPKSPCFTATATAVVKCPDYDKLGCVRPACIALTTTTLPPKRTDCPITPTKTIIPPCPTKCLGGCATETVTVTGAAYKA